MEPIQRSPYMNPYYADDEIDLIEYFKVIWKYKWMIVFVTCVAMLLSFIISKSMTPIFSSTVSIIIPQDEGASSISGMLGGLGFGGLIAGNSNAELIKEVIASRRMCSDLVREFGLQDHYNTMSGTGAAGTLKSNTTTVIGKSGIVTITVEDKNPSMAARLANYYVTNLDKINEELQITTKKPMVQVLDEAIPPVGPTKPNIRLNVMIAGILAGLITVFAAFVIEYVRNAVLEDKKGRSSTPEPTIRARMVHDAGVKVDV